MATRSTSKPACPCGQSVCKTPYTLTLDQASVSSCPTSLSLVSQMDKPSKFATTSRMASEVDHAHFLRKEHAFADHLRLTIPAAAKAGDKTVKQASMDTWVTKGDTLTQTTFCNIPWQFAQTSCASLLQVHFTINACDSTSPAGNTQLLHLASRCPVTATSIFFAKLQVDTHQ